MWSAKTCLNKMLMICGLALGDHNSYQWHTQLLHHLLGIVDHCYILGLPVDHCGMLSLLSSNHHLQLIIRLICTLIRKSQAPCKICPIFFKVIVIQKKKKQPGLFSFWTTMTHFFFSGCHPRKSQVSCQPEKNKAADFTGYPSNNFQGCRLNGGFSPVGMLEFQPIRGNYISSNVCRSDKNWAP